MLRVVVGHVPFMPESSGSCQTLAFGSDIVPSHLQFRPPRFGLALTIVDFQPFADYANRKRSANRETFVSKDPLGIDINAVARLRGTFRLRSGQTSTEYFDKYRFESDPMLLRRVAQRMLQLVPAGTEVLAGLELGGVPIATAMSLESGLPHCLQRDAALVGLSAVIAAKAAPRIGRN